ncbi:hypothetical protein AN639_01550 [Candidatus Epulonipiscium fishelsonii]|uniref:Uncharacterized protein n=1 Tax=Candidatus Epulonipiscium fishelsonii TaxID=77094 RepID=A0ACC8XB41_9FIRM|nr:hypothetical protein AN639_01550 [Epulopiscium sp. SCG-B05WGA-EpuloA1]ONI39714.1 hypothetical protein AN396_07530 [Epulopiscium sp. SCG-B11WGA-EpuloA1]
MKKAILWVLLVVVCIGTYHLTNRTEIYTQRPGVEEVEQAKQLLSSDNMLYMDYKLKNTDIGEGEYKASGITRDTQVDYTFDIKKSGNYYLELEYKSAEDVLSEFTVEVSVNDKQPFEEMKTITLPLKWVDETKDYKIDGYGDETAPMQIKSSDLISTYLYDSSFKTALPLNFYLEEGENIISITNMASDGLEVGDLRITPAESNLPTYEEYIESIGASYEETVGVLHSINAIDYISKSSIGAIYNTENNPSLSPYEVEYKKLNTITYKQAGINIEYPVEIEQDGYYSLAFHYRNKKEEFSSFATIYIDNNIPFEECISYEFAPTGNSYKNITLSDQENVPYKFYLTKGTHTISIRGEREPIMQAYEYGRMLCEHITKFGLDITKISGGSIDENRTWKMTKYIDNIPEYLWAYEVIINEMRAMLMQYGEYASASALFADLDEAQMFIDNMQEYPDEIALYINELTGKDASVLTSLSNFTTALMVEDFSLDMIYVYNNHELPAESVGVLANVRNWFELLLNSFTTNKYDVKEVPEGELTVWVNRAITHVDLLQKMVDTNFTPQTGIKVNISAMPDANKLVMSAAANDTPDVALGLGSHLPFELASRGALYDMTQFEDFWSVADRFVEGVFVPYTFNEGVYAIPETIDFHVLAYRKDILENLDLDVPSTWDDVIGMLPTLSRYGMNFYHNISSGVGYKWFYQTSSLIFQNDGQIYAEDGLTTALDTPNSIKGLQALGDLFIKYSLDTQVNSFLSSFRYATLPIGIVDSTEYILIKNGAPELEGQWAIAPYPATEKEDGTLDRSYVAGTTGGIIFDDTQMPQEAFEFLKWWTDEQTQVSYAHTLRSTYGEEFFWLSANIEALKDAPIAQQDKQVILDQVEWIKDVPRTPGQYLVERGISDAWNEMVFKGTSAQVAMDEQVIAINREMEKKMRELGYIDEDGNLLKSYVIRDDEWIKDQIEKEGTR